MHRFHILKNLNERATLAFQKLFQGRISIPVTQNIRYEILINTTAQQIRLVKKLRGEGRSKSEIILLTGMSERTVKKYSDMRECDIPKEKQTVRGREHEEAVSKLLECAGRVKALSESGLKCFSRTFFVFRHSRKFCSKEFSLRAEKQL